MFSNCIIRLFLPSKVWELDPRPEPCCSVKNLSQYSWSTFSFQVLLCKFRYTSIYQDKQVNSAISHGLSAADFTVMCTFPILLPPQIKLMHHLKFSLGLWPNRLKQPRCQMYESLFFFLLGHCKRGISLTCRCSHLNDSLTQFLPVGRF